MKTLNLTGDEFATLLLALGCAMSAAMEQDDLLLAHSFLRVANAVNRGNPHWIPYSVPEAKPAEADRNRKPN